jgi:uncharacterized Rmd1/YagE family protein
MVKQIYNEPKLKEISKTKKITDKDKFENTKLVLISNEEIFNKIENLPPERNKKGDGSKAAKIAQQINISESTFYQVKRILKYGKPELIDDVRAGRITIKEGAKRLKIKRTKQ